VAKKNRDLREGVSDPHDGIMFPMTWLLMNILLNLMTTLDGLEAMPSLVEDSKLLHNDEGSLEKVFTDKETLDSLVPHVLYSFLFSFMLCFM